MIAHLPSIRLAIYAGTFDPITNGHLDIIHRSLRLFDRVVVAVAENLRKTPLFSPQERQLFIQEAVGTEPRLEVDVFSGLLMEYARRRGAFCVIRGLRVLADFEYEFQLAHINRRIDQEIETIFMMTGEENFYVSSSMVKEVAYWGGNVSALVPANVARALQERLGPGKSNQVGPLQKTRGEF